MSTKYRSKLSTYREPAPLRRTHSAMLGRIDPQKAEVLLDFVKRLLNDGADTEVEKERRMLSRNPYPGSVLLTPLDHRGQPRVDQTELVVGKDLSPGGLGFVHSRAIRDDRVLLTFRMDGQPAPICLLSMVRRVQPIRQGMYLIGTEFVERVVLGEVNGGSAGTSQESSRK